jgi:hypothetical protein
MWIRPNISKMRARAVPRRATSHKKKLRNPSMKRKELIASFGIASFGISSFGISSFGIASFGIASFDFGDFGPPKVVNRRA